MKRHTVSPRENWQATVEEQGFTYHTAGMQGESGNGTYWDETVAYEFSAQEVDVLEDATNELHARCLDTVDHIFRNPELMTRMGVPPLYHEYIKWSWARQDPSLYGRFDFAYDGVNPPKLLEYNADTPTMVIETAIVQWFWLQNKRFGADQFNSLHEKLQARFGTIKPLMQPGERFYFAGYGDNEEERQTCVYLQDLATQAGLSTEFIDLREIGWLNNQFVDQQDRPIKYWFKLYPWEWMVEDEFGSLTTNDVSGIVEPIWKMLLSNKAMMVVMSELFPDHPNLLHTTWTEQEQKGDYVAKPILSREGANIRLVENGKVTAETDGVYHGPKIYQQKAKLFEQDGNFAVIGSWVVGNESAGMIIRDHNRPIVQDLSRVVPHWFN